MTRASTIQRARLAAATLRGMVRRQGGGIYGMVWLVRRGLWLMPSLFFSDVTKHGSKESDAAISTPTISPNTDDQFVVWTAEERNNSDLSTHDQLLLDLHGGYASLPGTCTSHLQDVFFLKEPESLGYLVLGPLVMDYLAWVARLALETDSRNLLFLSREGYLLHRAFQIIHAGCPALSQMDHRYLLASRRGVGTPSLSGPGHLTHLLNSTFEGTLSDLLVARLGHPATARVRRSLGTKVMSRQVFLPEMHDQILRMLRPAMSEILDQASIEREAYLRYFGRPSGAAIVADLGYAGTIQSHLCRLTGSRLGGAYFAVNAGITQLQSQGSWARARYWEESGNSSPQPPVMRHHLLLETFLTSPEGQFSHFEANGEYVRPVFLPCEHDTHSLDTIKRTHDGAVRFVDDVCKRMGHDAYKLSLDPHLAQRPLHFIGEGIWACGPWLADLGMLDLFTGRGRVPASPIR